ncbi:hypothetical protein CWR48_15375 [Oceanobacillus arenosus]|uniref:Signal transduction histidine kinase 5TM receptor LytS transmembrane region domain-containing protein n=1 Tax=Oceanobacillus arenosus TaxID=1229153 RepID=A0A3D8PN21_9BACI|nr:hypothetical protein CWR48_15375 [Oceanobacillus arenosus]
MLIRLFERAALLLIVLFLLTRIPLFKETLQRDMHSSLELTINTIIFSVFAIFSTYSGIDVEGSLVNVRIVTMVRISAGEILYQEA